MNVKFLLLQAFSLYIFGSAGFCAACIGSSQANDARKVTRLGKKPISGALDQVSFRAGATVSQQQPYLAANVAPIKTCQHKASTPLPKIKSLISKLTFSWTSDLLRLGNKRPLEISDLWRMPEEQEMKQTAQQFIEILAEERRATSSEPHKKKNILQKYWASPVTRALVKMYSKEFVQSGLVKFVNTLVQFLPSLLITRILKFSNQQKEAFALAKGWRYLLKNHGIQLCVLLFICLSTKTAIENQYFDMVTNVGAQIRGALSTAIYQKALRLGAGSRQNVTVGEIVNYMQIDTTRLEYVASTIHTVWDGLLQIFGYTCLLLYFLGPSVFAGIAAMLFILPLNAYFLAK
ncbi:hypothetical protein EON64_01135 [archaeon]|nr:MAG: hypothetical protein EON64_01135 [archaeon]